MKRLRTAPLALALQLGLLLLLALVMLMPLLWLLSTSLKGPAEDIFSSPPNLWPLQPSLQAYGSLFSQSPMAKYLFNSALVSGFSVMANLLFCSLAAFPLGAYAVSRQGHGSGFGGCNNIDSISSGDDSFVCVDGATWLA